MIRLGRFFAGLLGWTNPLRDLFAGLWRWACAHPWQALAVLQLIVLGIVVHELRSEREDNARLRADIAEIAKGQKQAARDQAAVNHAPAAASQAIARESRIDEKALYEAGRRAGAAYADAHRVRASAPVCPATHADLPGADRPAPQHDGAGDDADMVAVSRANFDTCTINSQRIGKVYEDAWKLIGAGAAVPDRSSPDGSTGGQ